MGLPIVDNMRIPSLGITLVDMERVPKQQGIEAEQILVQVLQHQVLQRQRPAAELCRTEQFEHENELYAEASAGEQGLTFTVHRQRAGDAIVRDDSDCDPRLPIKKFLVVTDAQNIIGTFTLYNIQIKRDEELGITASAMAMPGCIPAPARTMRETWTGIMRWILENDFVIGTRTVDFIEWRFPTRSTHQWKLTPDEEARIAPEDSAAEIPSRGLEVADLADHDLVKEDGVPVRVRRRMPRGIRQG